MNILFFAANFRRMQGGGGITSVPGGSRGGYSGQDRNPRNRMGYPRSSQNRMGYAGTSLAISHVRTVVC